MALIIGLMPVLPKHIYETRDIQAATLDFPIGSGPYVVDEITPGAQVRFQRNPNYWGANLPVMAGRHNISTWLMIIIATKVPPLKRLNPAL